MSTKPDQYQPDESRDSQVMEVIEVPPVRRHSESEVDEQEPAYGVEGDVPEEDQSEDGHDEDMGGPSGEEEPDEATDAEETDDELADSSQDGPPSESLF